MIDFKCNGCGRGFTVPDHYAGRKAKCKTCGSAVTVPYAAEVLTVPVQEPAAAAAATPSPAEATLPRRPSRAPPAPSKAAPVAVTRPGVSRLPTRTPPAPAARSAGTAVAEAPRPAPPPPPASPTPGRPPMRTRRLMADARQMAQAFTNSPLIRVWPLDGSVDGEGDPPEKYHVEYAVNGLERASRKGIAPVVRERHVVEIQLTSNYPRQAPKCKMLTPVFHPNIDPSTICVGDHWTAGERLVDLVVRIGEMIAYQAYNIKSPLDAEAAMWADLNADKLPIDGRSLRPAELD